MIKTFIKTALFLCVTLVNGSFASSIDKENLSEEKISLKKPLDLKTKSEFVSTLKSFSLLPEDQKTVSLLNIDPETPHWGRNFAEFVNRNKSKLKLRKDLKIYIFSIQGDSTEPKIERIGQFIIRNYKIENNEKFSVLNHRQKNEADSLVDLIFGLE